MSKKQEIYLSIIKAIFVLIFVGLAINEFVSGSNTNGILWLILAQLYDNGVRNENRN